jgi:RNA polymerase sigma-70 factor (ECF subfamily)
MAVGGGTRVADLAPDLIRRARAGDGQAMHRLITDVTPMLQRYARARLDNALRARMDEGDVVQSALLEVTRDFEGFSGTTINEFRAWARGILRRNLLDEVKAQVRAKKRALAMERALDAEHGNTTNRRLLGIPASRLTSPSRKIARREEVARLLRIMDELSEAQRRALDLWLAGYTVKEIAVSIGKSELSAASLLKRALQHIRERAAEEP